MQEKILIVDDESNIRTILKHLLKDEGYMVRTAEDGYKAIRISREFLPDLILMDQNMPNMSGLETMIKIREHYPNQIIIILTAHGAVSLAVTAIKKGAYDYLEKPFDNDKLLMLIRRALSYNKVTNELQQLREEVHEKFSFKNVIGHSTSLTEVLEKVKSVCQTDATVILNGESGSGKEVIAKAIHYNSHRKNEQMITVNCGAIPESLIESELFGHEKGAFTDAKELHIGKFEQADNKTLFLDEIGELPLSAQVKLLRILEEKCVTRVGGKESIPIDIRIISATNRNLEEEVREGRFRLDLLYRLNIFTITVPSLRERKEDIPLLVDHFIDKFNRLLGLKIETISQIAIERLSKYNWPGNIRDLENAIQSSMILAGKGAITEEHLPLRLRERSDIDIKDELGDGSLEDKIKVVNERVERELILDALRQCNYNRSKTAEHLMISRKTLFNKMKQYGI